MLDGLVSEIEHARSSEEVGGLIGRADVGRLVGCWPCRLLGWQVGRQVGW